MSSPRAFSAVLAALGVLVSLLAVTASAMAAVPSVRVAGTSAPAAASAPRVGAVSSSSRIDFEVELALPHQVAAEAFAHAASTPGNAQYGRYLSAAAWEQRFSPSAGEVSEVERYLEQSGLTVTGVSADRMVIRVSGSAGTIERTFGTTLSYRRVDDKRLRFTDRNIAVPAALAQVVAGVAGLDQVIARPDSTTDNPASSSATTAVTPQPPGFRVAHPCASYYSQLLDTTLPPFGGGYPSPAPWAVCGYTPPQLRSAYGLTSGADGSRVTVAIVDAYASPTLFSDAHHYAQLNDPSHPLSSGQFGELLPSSFNDQDPCGASGWYGEETLDVEAVHTTAPGANILYAGGHNCGEADLNEAVRSVVDGHLASVITNSYGDDGGDILDSPSMRADVDNVLMMAAGTGISVLFSSGDDGDEYTTIGQVAADYPTSSPWATGVGGTTLQLGAGGQRSGEFGWSTARAFLCNQTYEAGGGCTASQLGQWLPIQQSLDGASGGGTSQVYPQPSYQAGVVPTSLSEAGGGPAPMRVSPDISMDADPATGFLEGETQTFPNGVYYDQYRIGGTSLSSPLFAGVIARADETAGHALGFLNPALYGLYRVPGAFYDVLPAGKQDMSRADFANSITEFDGKLYTTRIIDYEGREEFCETTGKCRTREVALHTAPGYDNMTGLGSIGTAFLSALTGP